MITILQRVTHSSVVIDGEVVGKGEKGLLILAGVEKGDDEKDAELLVEKILKMRIFEDENGKMNLSVTDVDGDVVIVPNFTLLAAYKKGNRPDYFSAATPVDANNLYEYFIKIISKKVRKTANGKFGADMRTEMSTDGPVTIVMNSQVLKGGKK